MKALLVLERMECKVHWTVAQIGNVPVISRCFTLKARLALMFRNVLDEVSYVSYTIQRIEGHSRNNLQHHELGVP